MTPSELKEKLIQSFTNQGFHLNGSLTPHFKNKEFLKTIQSHARREQLKLNQSFLKSNIDKMSRFLLDPNTFDPSKINLEIRIVEPGSLDEIIYRWWNLMWWSVPYQKAYGRQIRILVWDTTHNCPFGLIGLQSPVLKMSVRDNFLKIPKEKLDYLINKSMQAQRLGALPPYNYLLGGKMISLALTSNEVRNIYELKYANYKTLIKERIISSELLFITTTSAFGKSSVYNRLKYKNEIVAQNLGFTKGAGTFHIPQELYPDIQSFLQENKIDTNTTFGYGPSRKVKLVDKALNLLGMKEYHFHNINREFFLFPLVKNLEKIIAQDERPIYNDRPLIELTTFWKDRYLANRIHQNSTWQTFNFNLFVNEVFKEL